MLRMIGCKDNMLYIWYYTCTCFYVWKKSCLAVLLVRLQFFLWPTTTGEFSSVFTVCNNCDLTQSYRFNFESKVIWLYCDIIAVWSFVYWSFSLSFENVYVCILIHLAPILIELYSLFLCLYCTYRCCLFLFKSTMHFPVYKLQWRLC